MKGVFTHEFRIRFSSLHQDLSRVVGKGIKTMKSFHVWVCGLWCSISASKWSAVLVLRERDSSAVINSACNCTNRLTFQLCRIFIRVQLTKETSSYCHPSLGVQLSFVMPKGSTLLRALTLYPPLWPTWWFHHLVKHLRLAPNTSQPPQSGAQFKKPLFSLFVTAVQRMFFF